MKRSCSAPQNSRMAFRTEPSPNRIIRSRHDSLMVLTKRSAWALRLGERGGSFTDCTPLASKISRNSAVNRGSRSWIKNLLPIRKPSAASLRLRDHRAHPKPSGIPRDAGDLNPPTRQVDEEEHQESRQTLARRGLDGEEIGSH